MLRRLRLTAAFALGLSTLLAAIPVDSGQRPDVGKIVEQTIRPVMARYHIAGMAVGIVVGGGEYVYNYGVMSKETGSPVTDDTLFEVGSVSKTFTATLVSLAQVTRHLSLSDSVSKYLPALRGSSFGRITLLNLGAHTSGGLPLQVPDDVRTGDQLMGYLRDWKPACEPGTCRTYSNISIGVLGLIAAKSLHEDFTVLMERRLFPMLGLRNSYINVPPAKMRDYAQGYTSTDAPIRVTPGLLAEEAYGVKTTAGDLIHFVKENMGRPSVSGNLRQAIVNTHTGYYAVGAMTQDLIWEQYHYPVLLRDLVAGNSGSMSLKPNAATKLSPPLLPKEPVLMNKTGSTNGFGAYVAFVPSKRIGIVILGNKNYPNDARVTAALSILRQLTSP